METSESVKRGGNQVSAAAGETQSESFSPMATGGQSQIRSLAYAMMSDEGVLQQEIELKENVAYGP